MRSVLVLTLAICGLSTAAFAQSNCYAPPADVPCDYAGQCNVCRQSPCCCPREGLPPSQPMMGPPGMFATPPAVGDVAGESNALGIRGLSLRFPEINIELPSLRLPNLFHIRRDAEFLSDQAHAPFVSGPAAVYGQLSPGGNAFTTNQLAAVQMYAQQRSPGCSGTAAAAAPQSPGSSELDFLRRQLDEQRARNDELQEKMDKLLECVRDLQAQRSSAPHQHVTHAHHHHAHTPVQHTGYSQSVTNSSQPVRHESSGSHKQQRQQPAGRTNEESSQWKKSGTLDFLANLRPSFDWIAEDKQ